MSTARDLLASQMCSPQCLLSIGTEADGCTCRCVGQWHGVLADAEVGPLPAPWWEHIDHACPDDLDAICPMLPDTVPAFNRVYRAAKAKDAIFVAGQRKGTNSYRLVTDTMTASWDAELTAEAAGKWKALLIAMLRSGRCESATPGASLSYVYGLRTPIEVQVLGEIFLCLSRNDHDLAEQAIQSVQPARLAT